MRLRGFRIRALRAGAECDILLVAGTRVAAGGATVAAIGEHERVVEIDEAGVRRGVGVGFGAAIAARRHGAPRHATRTGPSSSVRSAAL